MPELWDVYDEHRIKKPYTHTRGEPLQDGDFHLVVEIWTFTPDGRLLLTLRHPDKPFGGTWECTGGSALMGENSLAAVHRELREETGLHLGDAIPTLLTTVTDHEKHTIYDLYAVRLNFTLDDVTLQDGETVDKRLVDFAFVEDTANDALLCPPQVERLRTAALPFLRRFLDGAECWDMYSHEGQFLGYNRIRPISKEEQQHPWEASHAAIAIIQNLHGDVLLTQRAPHKAAGLKWGCTGGGVATGETTLLALQRETAEEIGLDITDTSPILLNKFLLDGDFGKWCLHVYLIRTDLTLDMLTFQPDEVIDAQFVPPPALNDHPLVAGILRRDPNILPTLLSGK